MKLGIYKGICYLCSDVKVGLWNYALYLHYFFHYKDPTEFVLHDVSKKQISWNTVAYPLANTLDPAYKKLLVLLVAPTLPL